MLMRLSACFVLLFLLAACNRPVARFTYTSEDQRAPSKVQFSNESKNSDRYEWVFGDDNTSEEASPAHVFKRSGNYKVALRAIKDKKSRTVEETITVKPPDKCLVEIETQFGNMLVELFDATPAHRDNFTKLAAEGFFNDLLFHRVIGGFMIQGGDPNSRDAKEGQPLGNGGPGYTIPAEIVDTLVHIKGMLAAARLPDQVNPKKESSGSQFYIVQGDLLTDQMLDMLEARKGRRYTTEQREALKTLGGTPHLDGEYTVFGRVVQGLEVIDRITSVATDGRNRPNRDVKMKIHLIN